MGILGILGFVLLIGLVILGLGASGRVIYFIDIPVILIVVGGLIAGLIMSFGSKAVKATRTVFDQGAERKSLIAAILCFEKAKSFTIAGGVLGSLIGLVLSWRQLDDPTLTGPVLALTLLCPIYSIFMTYAMFLPLVASLQRRLEELEE